MELVEALRSGRYKQGLGRLRKNDQFCCLGVACDIADKHGWFSHPTETQTLYSHHGASVSLPVKVQEYFGFYSSTGRPQDNQRIDIDGQPISFDSLEMANDEGCTFEEIANYIEAKWELL
jgi:hypothetical protein